MSYAELLYRLEDLGAGTINWFWIPLLLWTLLALVVYGLLKLEQFQSDPVLRARILHFTLLALPLGFVASVAIRGMILLFPNEVYHEVAGWVYSTPQVVEPRTFRSAPSRPTLPQIGFVAWAAVAFLVAVALAVLQLARYAREHVALRRYAFRLNYVSAERVGANPLPFPLTVHWALGDEQSVPMTFGWLRPIVVIPEYLLDNATEMAMALRHELMHVLSRDYLRYNIERLITSVFVINPVVDLLHREAVATRELACDAAVLDDHSSSTHSYADLLFRLSTQPVMPGVASLCAHGAPLTQRLRAIEAHRPGLATVRLFQASGAVMGMALMFFIAFTLCMPDLEEIAPVKNVRSFHNLGHMTNVRSIFGSTPVRRFSFNKADIIIDGEVIGQWRGIAAPSNLILFVYSRKHGLFAFSWRRFPGANLAGSVYSNTLVVTAGGHKLRIVSKDSIMGPGASTLFVRYTPRHAAALLDDAAMSYKGPSLARAESAFGSTFRISSLDQIDPRLQGITYDEFRKERDV